jgi:Single-strand binding protein family
MFRPTDPSELAKRWFTDRLGSRSPRFFVPQENGAENRESNFMSYLNAVTLVGFGGADPEQRKARNGGAKFTVLSVATQRSWKNAEDEWVSKVEWHRVAIIWNHM